MNQITTLPLYTELTDALDAAAADMSGAEAHGILCGLICATAGRTDPPWDKLIPGLTQHPESFTALKKLYTTSYQQISEFSFEFTLMLPDEETDINARAEALGFFCQGFLIGLRLGPRAIEDGASIEAVEALEDMTEIAQVDHGDLTASEEDENAYVDLVEYVRLAVLMLYHELKSDAKTGRAGNDNLLH